VLYSIRFHTVVVVAVAVAVVVMVIAVFVDDAFLVIFLYLLKMHFVLLVRFVCELSFVHKIWF